MVKVELTTRIQVVDEVDVKVRHLVRKVVFDRSGDGAEEQG
jgi:hypothetical protein